MTVKCIPDIFLFKKKGADQRLTLLHHYFFVDEIPAELKIYFVKDKLRQFRTSLPAKLKQPKQKSKPLTIF